MTMTETTKQKRRFPWGLVITLVIYALIFTAFGYGLKTAMGWLESWLTDYEAAQPKVKCAQVFDELFAQPDWEALYTMAGGEDTVYESAEHYSAYMTEKLGSGKLTYSETSAGLSGDHKYIVKLGEEKVAEFTLTAQEHTVTDIPEWELGTVSIFFTRQQNVTVCTAPENRVFVNGVELTQEHTVKTMETAVESYLPEGVHGLRRRWVYLDGLLVHPEVTAVNEAGEQVELVYDEATNTYSEPLPNASMTAEQEETVLEAAKAYCRYMVHALGKTGLTYYFDENSEIYSIVTSAETWMLRYKDYRFGEHSFSEYLRYSDSLYSVKVNLSLFGESYWGSEKEFPVDATFFLHLTEEGQWLVCQMVNVEVQKPSYQVRMRYIADGQVVADQMVDATAEDLTPPAVTVPEGKVFAGWYLQRTDEAGNTTYDLAFTPDENGNVHLSQSVGQQDMTLYALFENAK